MKKFITRIIIVLLLVYVGLFCLDFMVTSGLKQTEYSNYKEWNAVLKGDVEADVVFFGGSDAVQHFSTSIFDSITSLNSYNLGLTGHNFYMSHFLINEYLEKNPKPKYVIHATNAKLLKKRNELYDYQLFLPYMDLNGLTDYMKNYDGLNSFEYILPFIKYSGELDLIKVGLLEYFGIRQYSNNKYKGHISLNHPWNQSLMDSFEATYPNNIELHTESVDLFNNYAAALKKNGIQLLMVVTPTFIEEQKLRQNRQDILDLYQIMGEKYDAIFLDYSRHPICFDQKYFYDIEHLRTLGVNEFATKFSNDFLSLIND